MPRFYLRHITKARYFRGEQIDGEAFQLRDGENGLSLTRLPEPPGEWEGFVQGYWSESGLPSGDLPALALLSDDDVEALKLQVESKPDDENPEHFEIPGVTEDLATQLAQAATAHGMVAPLFNKGKLKEPDNALRSTRCYVTTPVDESSADQS